MGYTVMGYSAATEMAYRWGTGFSSLHIYRCEVEGVYAAMDDFAQKSAIKKMEGYVEYLVKLGHPNAYLIAADKWNQMKIHSRSEKNEAYCKEKALECIRKSIERKEDDINFYCVKFLTEYGEKEEAVKVCEEILKNKRHRAYRKAESYLKREKKRNSFLGKFDVGVFRFSETPLFHLLYLGISCFLSIFGIGLILLGSFIVKKIKLSTSETTTWGLEERIFNIKYDRLLDSAPMKVEFVDEDSAFSATQERRYAQDIERIMNESPVIREKKLPQFLERAKKGDQVALAALEFFYGIFYQDGEFVEKGPVSGVTSERLGFTLHK